MPPLSRWDRTVYICPNCGYDLRGTPGNLCSECGVEPESFLTNAAKAELRVDRICCILMLGPIAWLFYCLWSGLPILDELPGSWIPFVILNLPLLICLDSLALLCLNSKERSIRRAGRKVAVVALIWSAVGAGALVLLS